MVVEFIGCTGTGKTTLLSTVESRLSGTMPTAKAADLVTGLVGANRVCHPTLQNVILEVVGLPYCLSSVHHYRAFLSWLLKAMLRDVRPSVISVSNLRSIERKLAVDTVVRRLSTEALVLVDEGPLQALHMFVNAYRRADVECAAFAAAVPLPDLVVHVTAPTTSIVERSLHRRDRPRAIRACCASEMTQYIESATKLFTELVACLTGKVPVVTVDNCQSDDVVVEPIVKAIARVMNSRLASACAN